ncbi:MAG: hypothetical protein WKF77_31785 [Planctomycetaceae bacterium]
MKHELPADWLSAYLDQELTPGERAAAEARLAESSIEQEQLSGLRELDQSLRHVLVAPEFSGARFLADLERRAAQVADARDFPSTVTLSRNDDRLSPSQNSLRGRGRIVTVTTVVTLLSGVAVLFLASQFTGGPSGVVANGADKSVARVVRTVGAVEYRRPQDSGWQRFDAGAAIPIAAGARLRTPPSSLCEVETAAHDVLRLNQETEVIVHKAEQIELVSGELWCSTSTSPQFTILVPGSSPEFESTPTTPGLSQFQCPSNSETQWSVTDEETRCLGVSDTKTELTMTELKVPDAKTPSLLSCVVEPGQSLWVVNDQRPVAKGREDRLLATGWQLPLLAVRQPDDPELQSRLQALLAKIGQTKMSSMYDTQIRSLGPAGTIPLIAFVRSPKSLDNPELRHQAMQIIADLAPASTRRDLESLASDSDLTVSQFANAALARLSKQRSG